MKTNKAVALTLAAIILTSGIGTSASAAVAAPSPTASTIAGSTFSPNVATAANASLVKVSAPVLTVGKIASDRVMLSWNKPAVTGTVISYKLKVMQGTKTVKTTTLFGSPVYNRVVTGLDEGKKYTAIVEVTAMSKNGKKTATSRSAAKSFTTTLSAASTVKISAPTSLKVSTSRTGSTLIWKKPMVTGKIASYTVILKQGTKTLKTSTVNGSTVKLAVTGMKANTAYSFQVKANAVSANGKYKASSGYSTFAFKTIK